MVAIRLARTSAATSVARLACGTTACRTSRAPDVSARVMPNAMRPSTWWGVADAWRANEDEKRAPGVGRCVVRGVHHQADAVCGLRRQHVAQQEVQQDV